MSIPVRNEEVHDDVGEEDELHALEIQQLLGEAPEEAELEGGEEGGVDGPQEHHVHPDPVPSAADRARNMASWHCTVYLKPLSILSQSELPHSHAELL